MLAKSVKKELSQKFDDLIIDKHCLRDSVYFLTTKNYSAKRGIIKTTGIRQWFLFQSIFIVIFYIKNFFLLSLRLEKSSSASISLLLADSRKAIPSTRQPVVFWIYSTTGI